MKSIIIFLCFIFYADSIIKAGTTGVALDLAANAYEKSLSYSGVAIGDDIGGISYNPAIIAEQNALCGSLTHLNYIQEINMFYGNFLYPYNNKFNFAGNFGYMFAPTITDYDANKELKYREFFIGGGIGYKLNKNISVGGEIDLYSVTISDYSGVTFFIDAGINYKTSLPLIGSHKIIIGTSILNLGPGIKFKEQNSSLPLNYNLGVKYIYQENYRFLYGIRKSVDNKNIMWSAGAELVMFQFFSARLSSYSDINNNIKFNMGIGFKINFKGYDFIFDYTSLPLEELEYSNLITLTFKFPATGEKK